MKKNTFDGYPCTINLNKKYPARFLKFDLIFPHEKKVEFLHL